MAKTSADLGPTAVDLRMAVGRIGRRLRQLYATPDAATDPGFLEVAILIRLDRLGPLTSRALAEIESVTPQAIGTALSALQKRGFVVRAQDPKDGRKVISTITESGRRMLAGREHAVNEHMRRTLSDSFDASEQVQIAAVIPLLERLADDLSYTPEQHAQLARRRDELGERRIRAAEREWADLIDAVKTERAAGTDPTDPRVLELARRWRRLIEQFTGGDEGIHQSLATMYREQGPQAASRGMVNPELMEYVGRALDALNNAN